MMTDLLFTPVAFVAGVFAALWLCLELGRWLARRGLGRSGAGGAADSAIFALFGLLIAFTFSGAAERFDHRRHLIVEEANAIGTAYLRVDLAPADAQPALRDAFRRYARSRVDAYAVVADAPAFSAALDRSAAVQAEIWRLATAAGRRPDALPAANMLLLPALNEMIDITATRALATLMHPPVAIYLMLLAVSLIGAVLAGFGLGPGPRDWLRMLTFTVTTTIALWVIVDMEYPRLGLITVDEFERAAIELADPT